MHGALTSSVKATAIKNDGAAVISLFDLTVAYDRHPIVHHLSGAFAKGSLTALVGPNGAGKSTLLKAIAGLLPLRSGRISIAPEASGRMAYLPQAAEVDRSFPLSVIDIVNFGHWRSVGAFGRIGQERRSQSNRAIAMVGLKGLENVPIGQLSLGQLQRVLFARLIVQDAPVILLDEPFNGIDSRVSSDLMSVVGTWGQEGRTVIAALHDVEQVHRLFPQSLVMARELVAWGPTAEVLNPANLSRAAELARAWSDPAEVCKIVA